MKPSGEAEDAAGVEVEHVVVVVVVVGAEDATKLTFNKTYLPAGSAHFVVVIDIIIISNCYRLDKFVL